ncbi:N-acetylmuramoyl-L-alanine amidase [Desulforamulus reducens MI-1]|uniref:N-acetylmuramoyl-L-alanine amidase n=1 Tax=Desulforamulus reducens (strain ATCC BAA-1160 / DSM 100696 / MI-1) TaxID=349161 RepID=A4J7Z6_DESRM|nr:N-acetylmuramoyl-L-alanine amidase [Desulforamulus reducens]ABO51199.1 N-acetylmuramoyl-L-alanine amidase [Desulforamulus reducens MI-1]
MILNLIYKRFFRYAVLAGLVFSIMFNPVGVNQPAYATQVVIVNVDKLNLRSGPDTNTAMMGQATKGTKLPVLAKNGDWYKVQIGGKTAWAAGWLVSVKDTPGKSAPAKAPEGTPAVNSGKVAVVKGDNLNIRSGPGTTYGIAGKVKKGDRLTVLTQKGDWIKVQGANVTGWVASWLVAVENKPTAPASVTSPTIAKPAPAGQVVVINSDNLNLRSGPGTSHSVAGQVSRGIRLPIISRSGQWLQVRQANGSTAWVAGWLVSVVDQPEPLEPQKPQQPSQPSQPSTEDNSWLPGLTPASSEQTGGSSDTEENKNVPKAKLVDIEVKEKEDHTYINIVSDKKINYNTFPLSSPSRYVVNLSDVYLDNTPETISANTELVGQIRTGYNQDPYYSRLVVDLKERARVKVSLSEDKKSLTLDISKISYSDGIKGKTVFLDAGHGGHDGGASGQNGLKEKDVNLDITLKVAELLRKQGANVFLSRSDDKFVDLYEITRLANEQSTDIFVSIHSNANLNRSIDGTSTYYYAPNNMPNLYEQKDDRYRLARNVQNELTAALGRRDIGVLQANFAVLRTSMMPSILIETAFISNSDEEALLSSEDFREKAAEAIVKGINAYFYGQ